MDSLYFLIPIALVLMALAVKFLFWAVNNGQYEDLDTEAHRILFDEEPGAKTDKKAHEPGLTSKHNDSDSAV